jgi:hypothetical protein
MNPHASVSVLEKTSRYITRATRPLAAKLFEGFVALILVCIHLACLYLGCKDDGTDPIPERIRLTLIDASVKETYLHIAVTNPASNETLALQRNGATVMTFAAVADTNIADTALTQTAAYQYAARLTANNETTGTSNTISAQTLAPTSHNFTWQTFLLGDGNNSSLYDVAIINDTLIYAVGEMYLRDSTGAIEDTPHNLAVWNGTRWRIERVPVPLCPNGTGYFPLRTLFAFAWNDIWLSGGGEMIHWNGQTFQGDCAINPLIQGIITRIWGSSSTNLYVVGGGGTLIHYNGTTWRRLESGTTTHILDAWGVLNPMTGKEEVYCAVTDFFDPNGKKILKIVDQTRIDSVRWNTGRDISSVWTNKGAPLYTTGDGIFENKQGVWNEINLGTSVYTNRIRGNRLNDICLVGSFGLLAHYNGMAWRVYSEVYNAVYSGLAVRDGIIAAIGERNGRGVVTIGRR